MLARRLVAAGAAVVAFTLVGAHQAHAADSTGLAAVDVAVADAVSTSGTATQAALDAYLAAKVDPRAHLVVPAATAGANVTALQQAIDSAASAGVPLLVRGSFTVDGQMRVPSGSDIDFSGALIIQKAALTPVIVVKDASGVRLRNLHVQGKTTDYQNSSSVYGAAAVRVVGTSSDVQVIDGVFAGVAGVGVFVDGTTREVVVRGCKMTGAGSRFITSTTDNYSAGIVVGPGAIRWSALNNDISGFSQGIVTGDDMADVRVIGNVIHDIPGQHGLYLETMSGGVLSNNVIRDAGLVGIKIQIGSASATDAQNIVISGNAVSSVGAQGILLANPLGAAARFRHVSLSDNVISQTGGHGIEIRSASDVQVTDNLVDSVRGGAGIRLVDSKQASVVDNRVSLVAQMGVDVNSTTDYEIRGNRISDPATANGSTTEWGIGLSGVATAYGVITDNRITDSRGNMRFGIYTVGGSTGAPKLNSHTFRDNSVSGATDYGYRGPASSTVREWVNNDLSGGRGSAMGAPISGRGRMAPQGFGRTVPTSGAHDVGEIVWNTNPSAGGTVGWVCTTAGTPGTWKPFGAIGQ